MEAASEAKGTSRIMNLLDVIAAYPFEKQLDPSLIILTSIFQRGIYFK